MQRKQLVVSRLNGHSKSSISGLVKHDIIIVGVISEGSEDKVTERIENRVFDHPTGTCLLTFHLQRLISANIHTNLKPPETRAPRLQLCLTVVYNFLRKIINHL